MAHFSYHLNGLIATQTADAISGCVCEGTSGTDWPVSWWTAGEGLASVLVGTTQLARALTEPTDREEPLLPLSSRARMSFPLLFLNIRTPGSPAFETWDLCQQPPWF